MRHSLSDARTAKQKLGKELKGLPELASIGLAGGGSDDYSVHVMLTRPIESNIIPKMVDDIPVSIEVIGKVAAY